MQYIKGIEAYKENQRTAVTLGKFDGLHRGHQKLIAKVKAHAAHEDVKSVVFAFDMGPLFQRIGKKQECIMTNEERRLRLEGEVDYLIECPFTEEICTMEAERFISEILVDRLHVKYVTVGTDFHFGHEKRGDFRMLREYAGQYGYQVEVVEKARCNGREISSTYVKEELKKGNIDTVNMLLGYSYLIAGEVEHGRKLGRTIGFPTMNVIPPPQKLLPPNGVYVNEIMIEGACYEGVCNIGVKPTVGTGFQPSVETFLFGYEGDAYGKNICIKVHDFEREERKFSSVSLLKAQMTKDIEYAKAYFRSRQ